MPKIMLFHVVDKPRKFNSYPRRQRRKHRRKTKNILVAEEIRIKFAELERDLEGSKNGE